VVKNLRESLILNLYLRSTWVSQNERPFCLPSIVDECHIARRYFLFAARRFSYYLYVLFDL